MNYSKDEILKILENVKDPEIPVLNVVEMGIVRSVSIDETGLQVNITPTYSGCPAMKTIEDEIKETLKLKGFDDVKVNTIYSSPWTTDWLSDETKKKLKDYGIAPPDKISEDDFLKNLFTKPITCPFCNSEDTKLTSEFGSTACKSLHFCNECCQPFEHFKCI